MIVLCGFIISELALHIISAIVIARVMRSYYVDQQINSLNLAPLLWTNHVVDPYFSFMV